jgi:hypothetical protein
MQKVFLLEDLRDETHVFAYVDSVSVGCGDACTFLTSVLQSIETKKGHPGDVLCRSVDSKDAAGFVEAFQGQDPRNRIRVPTHRNSTVRWRGGSNGAAGIRA